MAGVEGIGLSGQQHGATLLDKADKVLRPAILWNDARAFAECWEIEAREPRSRSIAGNIPLSEADKGETGARKVLLAWAHALERGDFDTAYAQWGAAAQQRSGLEATEHRQWWARFKTVTVAAQAGQMEGAAGSSYYTAPVSIVGKQRNGKPYRLEGTVTLRRVNDVPGATPDQLHWHLEKVDLHPVT